MITSRYPNTKLSAVLFSDSFAIYYALFAFIKAPIQMSLFSESQTGSCHENCVRDKGCPHRGDTVRMRQGPPVPRLRRGRDTLGAGVWRVGGEAERSGDSSVPLTAQPVLGG